MDTTNAPETAARSPEQIAASVEIRDVRVQSYLVSDYGWRRYNQRRTRIFVNVADESIGANFAMRHARPVDVYALLVPRIVEAANEILRDAGRAEIDAGYRARWDQNAGCSMCPCSPGFVVRADAAHGFAIFATVAPFDYELTAEQAETVEQRAGKMAQIAAGGV